MTGYNVSSNVTLTELQRQLLIYWKSFASIPLEANKLVPFTFDMIGLSANTMLLIYLIYSGKCRIAIFSMFTSLAVCDWFTCFLTILLAAFALPDVVDISGARQLCKAMVYVYALTYETSICHLVFLAALRFYQLVYPLQAKVRVTTRWVQKWCGAMWLVCATVTVPYPIFFTVDPVPYENGRLLIFYFAGSSEAKEISLSVFLQLIPLVIIALLHVVKFVKISKGSQISESEKRNASSRTVTLLITCFVLSILPRIVHTSYHSVLGFPYQPFHTAWFFYTTMVTAANSVLDPFLYLIGSKEIRQDLVRMLCCKLSRKTSNL